MSYKGYNQQRPNNNIQFLRAFLGGGPPEEGKSMVEQDRVGMKGDRMLFCKQTIYTSLHDFFCKQRLLFC